ncbi:hypothetical protein Taro_002736 [Colocasia esculenta]|uniref:Uncharacterized protein n=1 Tax=Colocasia esculenta TaxID=4460 RepID=A0A843TPL0_COLES|nr:hypothetical protein [Colocasia esculenta]
MTEMRLISTIVSSPPPPPSPRCPPKSIRALPVRREGGDVSLAVRVPRRIASLTLLPFPALLPLALSDWCPPAAAFSLGISGPKEWLRNQKKNAARFVLAPIDASRRSLQAAYLLLSADPGSRIESPGEVRKLFNSAVRDCVPEDRSSIVAFQARTGVEVCTFRLIVNNAASLLDKYDPLKLEAEEKLDNLIR